MWGKLACSEWWRQALRHPPASCRPDGTYLCHPLTQLAWASPLVTPPAELALLPQVRHTYATDIERNAVAGPSLLPFPGPGVTNSAACTSALSIDWPRVRAIAERLTAQPELEATVAEVTSDPLTRTWRVSAESMALVVAHALLDRPVAVRCVADGKPMAPDSSRAYAILRRAGRLDELPTPARRAVPRDDWREAPDGGRPMMLDASTVMSSRDLEPIVWPKVWHFSCKMRTFNDDEEACWRCFGAVPVRWVPAAGRWMSGSRHRLMAARLNGLDCAAVPASGSVQPR